jgi:hypothetical protein
MGLFQFRETFPKEDQNIRNIRTIMKVVND